MRSQPRGLQILTVWVLLLTLLAFSEFILLLDLLVLFFWLQYFTQRKALQSLRIHRSFTPGRLFEGEAFSLRLSWENPSSFSLNACLEPCEIKAGLEQTDLPLMFGARKSGAISLQGSFFHYGRVKPGSIKLFMEHPLKLYRLHRQIEAPDDIVVFPHLPELQFSKEALKIPLPGRKTSTRLLEDPSDMLKVRPYEREPWNRIHWKISAKLDQWMVKEFVFSASGAVHLLLDLNQPSSIYAREVWSLYRRQFESYAVKACSRLLFSLNAQRTPISLTLMGAKSQHLPLGLRDPVEDLEALLDQEGTDNNRISVLEYFISLHPLIRPTDTILLLTMHLDLDQLPHLITLRKRCSKIMALLFPYGYREEQLQAATDRLSAHPQAKELLQLATDLSSHHIHLRFVSAQESLQEGIHAFP